MRRILVLAFLVLAFSPQICLFAQTTTDGAIGGVVYDPTGAVVPNAGIVVHNNGTDAEQTITADAAGTYRVVHLNPGEYTVTITVAGFAPLKAEHVVVQVGTVTDLSPRLSLAGAQAEVVSVAADSPQVNTTSADFAPVIEEVQIHDLPMNNQRWSAFSLLTPGVVNDSNGFGLVSVKGMSTLLNNNTVDGADNNQAFFSEERGRTRAGYSSPKAAVQEFQVNTSNYSSEYGRSAGAVINTVTKSGTNAFHGEGYFYDRDVDWSARNPYTTIPTQVSPGVFQTVSYKPKDWRKISGFTLGGPAVKDKLFFFLNYDWYERNYPGITIANNSTNFFGAPACCTTSAASTLLNSGTAANISNLAQRLYGDNNASTQAQAQAVYNADFGALVSGTSGSVPRHGIQSIWFPKLDWQIDSKNHFSIEVNRMRWNSPAGIQTQSTNTYGIRSFGNDYVKNTWGVGRLDTFFTSTLANEFRFQYGRDFEFENPQSPTAWEQSNLVTSKMFPGYTNIYNLPPEILLSNGWTIGVPDFLNRPFYPDEKREQYSDTITWIQRNHSMKFGLDFTHVSDNLSNLRYQYGSFSYGTNMVNLISDLEKVNSCQTTLNGAAVNIPCYTSFQEGFGPQGYTFATNDYALFFQDDWKIKPRLTANLGLRWDYEQLPNPQIPNPAIPQTSVMPSRKNNFGPRVGFAYDVFGDGKTSLRGGAGIYYARIINSTISNAITNTGMPGGQFQYTFTPTSAATSACAPSFPQLFPDGATATLPAACQAGASIAFFDKNFKMPQIVQADMTLQRDLGWNTVVSLSYLGSFGRRLPDFTDLNVAPSTQTITYNVVDSTGAGPLKVPSITVPLFTKRLGLDGYSGALTDIISATSSNYNALAVQLSHRMSQHFQLATNFTWSHALDYGQNNTTFTSTNATLEPNNIAPEKGNSNQNIPLRFVFTAIGEAPWHQSGPLGYVVNGWKLSPAYQWQNGLPYSARTSGNAPGGLSGGMNGSNGDFRTYGLVRNGFQMPNTSVLDLRLSKVFDVAENYHMEVMMNTFNVFNHQNVTGVSTTGYTVGGTSAAPTLTYNTGFGSVTNSGSNYAYSQRLIEFAARVFF